jgi:glutamyl-tRNA reductase
MLNLVLVGLNHRTADISLRERAAIQEGQIPGALKSLSTLPGVQEAMIISTCNRVELLCRVDEVGEGLRSLESFLGSSSQIDPSQLRQNLYEYTEEGAIRHLFRVACSLDSMILGEPQILGQVKDFYTLAVETQTVGIYLNTLLQAAFRVAKRVRSETSIGEYSVSASSAAVELARKILGDLQRKSILIVGAGKMGEMAVRHLSSSGAAIIRVSNRSPQAAQELGARFHGEAVPFEELVYWMAHSDIVIASTAAQEVIVTRTMAESVMRERKHEPIVLIDIAVPRNIDPAVGTIDNVFCYDIDDLGAVVEANLQERRKAASMAEKIIDQELESICHRLKSLDITPVVMQLQGRIEEICRAELERYLSKSGTMDTKSRQELEAMVSRIAGKIAHPLISQLRANHPDPLQREALLTTIRRIFGISTSDSK